MINPYDQILVPFPPRKETALTGSEFFKLIEKESGQKREDLIFEEIVSGNVPSFIRQLTDIKINIGGSFLEYLVIPDYLAVGSDSDYFRVPLYPVTAQKIANLFNCILPTRKIVQTIWEKAVVRLDASQLTLPPNRPAPNDMVGSTYFMRHSNLINQRLAKVPYYSPGKLVAGHKKDVVISSLLAQRPNKVAIYGWHFPDGRPIQELNVSSHSASYCDYSHGIRLVCADVLLNNKSMRMTDILKGPLSSLVSDEGPVTNPSYVV